MLPLQLTEISCKYKMNEHEIKWIKAIEISAKNNKNDKTT